MDRKRISQLEAENAALKKKLKEYESFLNDTIDDIHQKETENSKELTEAKQSKDNTNTKQIDWKLIRLKYQQENDEYIMKLINDDIISVADDYDKYGDNIWSLACQYGRINIIKMCVHLGLDISNIKNKNGYDAAHIARSYNQDEILQYLIMEKIGAGKANDIVKSCDYMWNEDGVLSSFQSQLHKKEFVHLKQAIVAIVCNIIQNRDPISSFLINLSMSLDSVNTWQVVKNVMDQIINDTHDSIGWYYLNNYLLKNNTFLFRKYQLHSNENKNNDDDNDTDQKQQKQRKIDELNEKELIYFLTKTCICKYNTETKNNCSETECEMISNTITSEHINGSTFTQNYNDMMKLYSFLQSSGLDFDAIFPLASFLNDNFMSIPNINSLYDIPFIVEDEYGFDKICDDSIQKQSKHASNDIKHIFENEEKMNKNNWLFITKYGEDKQMKYGKNKRLRQDLLPNGIQSKYSKDEMIQIMRKTAGVGREFNGLKFYDSEIYLNQLMLRCVVLNHQFQVDVQLLFEQSKNVIFRAGPLKKKQRCTIKTETDYFNQEWPQSSCLLDIIRCTLTFENISALIDGIKLFENTIANNVKNASSGCIKEILRIKNGFADYSHSNPEYVDIKYNVGVCVNNMQCIGEVQLLLSDMGKFKLKAHKFYGIIRRKEYFDNLKLVTTLKNNVDKKLMIFCHQGNAKGIKDIIINQKIKNLNDLTRINRLNDSLWSLYHYGHVQCVKTFVAIFKNDKKSIAEFFKLPVSDFGGTGLMLSSFHGKFETAQYILSQFSEREYIFRRNDLGRNAFICCSFQGHYENAKLLLSKLKDKKDIINLIQSKTSNNENCLIEAAKNGHKNIISLILSKFDDKNDKIKMLKERDNSNMNAFDMACTNKQIKTAHFILSQFNDKKEALQIIKDCIGKLDQKMINTAVAISLKNWTQEFS